MVHINGKDIDAAGQSLAAYLKANDYEMGTFVVECNEEIIHKEDYENYMLKDGDIIEIVQFMGGGCGTSLMYREANFSWADVPVGTSLMYRFHSEKLQ